MKLYLMKQSALDTLKSNLSEVYGKYYTESSNEWIEDVCGEKPFVEFRDVPEFKLANLELSPGEIDLNNCKIIYEKLRFLSESQASDERLWAGLTHGVFYEYMRKRWGFGYGKKPQSKETEISGILTRFFFKTTGRGGFYRNTLAKCWWVGHNTYDAQNLKNHFDSLDVLGTNDLSSKINDLFYNYSFSSNPEVLSAIIESLRLFKKDGKNIHVRGHIRPALCYLNAIGGSIVIDCLSKEKITEIFTDAIEAYLQGDTPSADWDTSLGYEEDNSDVEDNLSLADVTIGCNITLCDDNNEEITYKYDYNEKGILLDSVKIFEGHKVGDIIEIEGKNWKISSISF